MSIENESPYGHFEADISSTIVDVRFSGEEVVEQTHAEHPEIEERPYQIDCLMSLSMTRARGEQRALIHMATGLGKTTVAALDVRQFIADKPDARLLFVAHQNDILRQAQDRFSLIIGTDKTYGMFNGEDKNGSTADCVFASFQMLHRSLDETFSPDDFDYIVVDESHHGKATTYEPSLRYFTPQFLLGMTATPDRRDLKEIRDIFGSEVYSKSLGEALSERLLARPDYKVVLDDIDESVLADGNVSKTSINKLVFIPKRDEQIAEIIQDKANKIQNPKAIIFCPSIEHAERMAALLPGGHALHSGLVSQERRDLLDSFINNGVSILTTVDVLNEGIDVADANMIVFLRSTQSRTIFQQQLGRGLRKTANKNSVLVMDFVANCDRLLMVDEIFGRYARNNDNQNAGYDTAKQRDDSSIYDVDFDADSDRETESLFDEIDIANLEFSETSRKILDILRQIEQRRNLGKNMNQEAAIEYYRGLSSRLGRVAMIDDIKVAYDSHLGPNRQQLLLNFEGSLRKLREAAEISDKWTAEDSVRVYLAISEKVGHPATPKDISDNSTEDDPTYWQLITPFDRKFSALKRASGFDGGRERKNWQHWEQEDAIEYYQELSDELGHPATNKNIDTASKADKGPSFMALSRFCDGSISNLKVLAGFEPSRKQWRNMSAEAALVYYTSMSNELGKVASVEDVIQYSQDNEGPSLGTLTQHFSGSIIELKKAAGFEARQRTEDWGKDECLSYYVTLANMLGRWPTIADIRDKSSKREGPNQNLLLKHYDQKISFIRDAAKSLVTFSV